MATNMFLNVKWIYVYTYINICVYAYMYTCLHVYMYMCPCIYVYMDTYTEQLVAEPFCGSPCMRQGCQALLLCALYEKRSNHSILGDPLPHPLDCD